MNVDWKRFCEVIAGANNVVLTSHIRPDCDALGSCLGMAGILESLGKKFVSFADRLCLPTWPLSTLTRK